MDPPGSDREQPASGTPGWRSLLVSTGFGLVMLAIALVCLTVLHLSAGDTFGAIATFFVAAEFMLVWYEKQTGPRGRT